MHITLLTNVTLNLFQGPFYTGRSLLDLKSLWMLKRVQHDGYAI